MNEAYLGSEQDRQYVQTYLSNIRRLDPIEIATLPIPINLADPRIADVIDVDWFWKIVTRSLEIFEERYAIRISPLKPERYYTAQPQRADDMGGFHSPSSLGYQYWYRASFVSTLRHETASKWLRTLELGRSFLHDCFHHSTFVSFRRTIRVPAKSPAEAKRRTPEVYREQYGINFRNEDGISYSAVELTAHSPETINLNLLMDGIIVLSVADSLKESITDLVNCERELEEEIRKEIFLEHFNESMLPLAHEFQKTITEPTQLFVNRWGGKPLTKLLLQSMMSGNLRPLKNFLEEQAGIPNIWEKKFKRPEFSLSLNPQVQ